VWGGGRTNSSIVNQSACPTPGLLPLLRLLLESKFKKRSNNFNFFLLLLQIHFFIFSEILSMLKNEIEEKYSRMKLKQKTKQANRYWVLKKTSHRKS
jgi:hypothetical protein